VEFGMISMSEYFLTEGVWSFIKNSIANLFGKRKPVSVRPSELTAEERIDQAHSIQRRLTPRPLAVSRKKLGFKEIT